MYVILIEIMIRANRDPKRLTSHSSSSRERKRERERERERTTSDAHQRAARPKPEINGREKEREERGESDKRRTSKNRMTEHTIQRPRKGKREKERKRERERERMTREQTKIQLIREHLPNQSSNRTPPNECPSSSYEITHDADWLRAPNVIGTRPSLWRTYASFASSLCQMDDSKTINPNHPQRRDKTIDAATDGGRGTPRLGRDSSIEEGERQTWTNTRRTRLLLQMDIPKPSILKPLIPNDYYCRANR